MKKIITLSLVVISTIFSIGCSSSKDLDQSYIANCDDNMSWMGKKYYINNLEGGNYEIEFTAKEYDYGVLKEEHVLYKSTIEHNGKDNTLKIWDIEKAECTYTYFLDIYATSVSVQGDKFVVGDTLGNVRFFKLEN